MSNIIPPEAQAHSYANADENMILRVLDGPDGPGLVLLSTLRQLTEAQLTTIRNQISGEIDARKSGDQAITQSIANETQARTTAITALAGRVSSLEGAQLRVELVRGTVATAGSPVAVTFSRAFAVAPTLLDITTWSADQMVASAAASLSTTGAQVVVKRSRGTLLLTAGPFENAPAGTAFVMLAIGR